MGFYEKEYNNFMTQLRSKVTSGTDKQITHSGFDKTYIGTVVCEYPSPNMTPGENVPSLGEQKGWYVYANGTMYIVTLERCDISYAGQPVRIYIPNNDRSEIYAEVINRSLVAHPDKIIYDDKTYTYTNQYNLLDGTIKEEQYVLTVNDVNTSTEEVTAITFPDGSVMRLEGFVI